MSNLAVGSQVSRPWIGRLAPARWLPAYSEPAVLRAIRTTIVVAGLFAFCDRVLDNRQMATFAAFGGFATLLLSSFGGSRRDKLIAHLLLALAGSVLLTIGTAVTSSTVLAALVTVPVTFTVFFAGIAGPNAASGATGALLAFILPAASPGTLALVPDRLAGWWLASLAGTAAVLALSPSDGVDALRKAAETLAAKLSHELRAAIMGDVSEQSLEDSIAAKHELQARFDASPYRPIGLAAADQAFANVVELLQWCSSLLLDTVHEGIDFRRATPVDRELLEAADEALAEIAALLGGARGRPDLDRLDRGRERSLAAAGEQLPPSATFTSDAHISFHAHTISVAVLALGAEALVAERVLDVHELEQDRRVFAAATEPLSSSRESSLAAAAVRHASLRSVWFINSLRGSLALAAAVAIADLSSVQHGFWVVLGTLSVLRTNAAATGATAVRAFTGTVIGFVVGGALLVLIGSHEEALWVVLPVAVFVAGYAPGTAPFAVGQAAFTVVVAVLFNLLAPVGWKVGLVRIEDVAIGCAVSVLVGAMFWPRGVSAVVAGDLAEAYRSGSRYLAQAVRWTAGLDGLEPDGAAASITDAIRLDDALRGFLAEQGSKRIAKQDLWRLVGGTLRLRLTAHAIARFPRDPIAVETARAALQGRMSTLSAWFERLAELLDRPAGSPLAGLEPPQFDPAHVVEESSGSHYGVWLCEYLDHISEHLTDLVQPAERLAALRRQPWWR